MRLEVTHRAATRFIQRHAPDLDVGEARAYLEEVWPRAGRLRARTTHGQEQWRLDEPPCVLVVKRDRDGTIAIVTVLPMEDVIGLDEASLDALDELGRGSPAVGEAIGAAQRAASSDGRRRDQRLADAVERLREQIEAVDRGARAEAERMRKHAATKEEGARRAREALRIVLRAIVMGEASDEAAIEAVRAIEPGFLSQKFLRG